MVGLPLKSGISSVRAQPGTTLLMLYKLTAVADATMICWTARSVSVPSDAVKTGSSPI